jgi:drug/metabolite transporter (DMT)-like permease
VVDPRFGLSPGLGFALLAGCFYGAYLTASRWLTDAGRPRQILITQLLIGAVVLMPVGLYHWPEMSTEIAAYTTVSALGSALGNLLLIVALGMAPASRLAPFVYIQLVAATLWGLLIFAEIPQERALQGLALILASGLATLFLRERR